MLHKDLDVWQKAMLAAKKTYSIAPQLPRDETYGIRSQLTRACSSVPCNIAEGMARETSADRAHFLMIARGSVAEANTLFEICDDLDWLPKDKTSEILSLIDDVGRMLTVMLRRYRKKP